MDRPNIIQVAYQGHDVDWQKASENIRIVGPKIVVEMVPPPEKVGSLYLPTVAGENSRADIGVVLKSPKGSFKVKKREAFYPNEGALVAVRPYDGEMYEDAVFGDYVAKSRIAIYGVAAELSGNPQYVEWWDSVVCEVTDEGYRPYGDKIVVKIDPAEAKIGDILIADIAKVSTGWCTVEAVGPLAPPEVRPGDRWTYSPRFLLETGLKFDGNEYAVCDERALLVGV